MSEIITSMARAICEGRHCRSGETKFTPPCPFCHIKVTTAGGEAGCIVMASAALTAAREPTEKMIDAAWPLMGGVDDPREVATAVWIAMVDEALKP